MTVPGDGERSSTPGAASVLVPPPVERGEPAFGASGPNPRQTLLPARQVLTEGVYEAVKRQIMDLELAPESRINMDQLARALEVSNTPLREALARLASEGLVSRRNLQGYRVAALPSRSDLEELFDLRAMLEAEAARRATGKMGSAYLEQLQTSVDEMRKPAGSSGPGERYARYRWLVQADAAFHDLIAETSGSRLLRRTLSGLHSHVVLYRVYFKVGAAPEGVETAEEHQAILDAMADAEPERAAASMREHLERSRRRLIGAYELAEDSPTGTSA